MARLRAKKLSFLLLASLAFAGGEHKPLYLERIIPLPGVEGRIDHLAVDLTGKRLFVAALGNNTVEVIDLDTGKPLEGISGLKEPQGVLYVPETGKLFVANGGDGSCRVFDGRSFQLLKTIKLDSDADNLRYDPANKQIYAGYGEGALAIIDSASEKHIGDIKLDAHPESFQLEKSGTRIFINVPKAGNVTVVDRARRAILAKWPTLVAHANYPMALDESGHRLFIGCRRPPRVVVLDTSSGKPVASLPIVSDTDDLFYDASMKRLYVSGGDGFLDVYEQTGLDHYSMLAKIPTAAGARTSLFVPELGRLYLVVPHRSSQTAEIRVYKTDKL